MNGLARIIDRRTGGLFIPRILQKLGQHGASALQFKVEKGKYIPPMISRRRAANLRKRAIIEGTYGSFSPEFGGWDPAWDQDNKKVYALRPYKGHVRDRNRAQRAEIITKAMSKMEDKINKYEQEVIDRKPKKDIFYLFKRIEEIHGNKSKVKEDKGKGASAAGKKDAGKKKDKK